MSEKIQFDNILGRLREKELATKITIDPATKHWVIDGVETEVSAEGVSPHIDPQTGNWFVGDQDTGIQAQGPKGNDAINPFKGWYDSSNDLPANPSVGDYAYVKSATASDPAAIYECTTAGTWTDSGRTADTSNVQTFQTGEEVNQTPIDDTHLVNPSEGALPTAADVMQLKAKMEGVTMEETKETAITDWYPEGSSSGFYNTSKEWTTNANFASTRIYVAGKSKVRFLGYNKSFATKYAYGFLDEESNPIGTFVEYYNANNPATGKCELVVDVPSDAVYFVCLRQAWSTNSAYQMFQASEFYCYLQSGKSVLDNIPQIVDNLQEGGTDKTLSAEQGKVLGDILFEKEQIISYALLSGYIINDGNVEEFGSQYWRYRGNSGGTSASSMLQKMTYIEIPPGAKSVSVKANNTYGTRVAFIKSGGDYWNSSQNLNNTVFLAEGTEIYSIAVGNTLILNIPADAIKLYVRLGTTIENLPFAPELIIFDVNRIDGLEKKMKDDASIETRKQFALMNKQIALSNIPVRKQDGWQGATTLQEQMAIEKADKLINCKWTPVTDGIKWSTRGTANINHYNGGVEYKGIPYSSNTDHGKWLGTHVSLYTFLTAVKNKYSLLYTEFIKNGYSQSAWGYVYASGNGSTYYGTVCCGFTSYCTNGNVVYNNISFWSRDDAFTIIQLHNQDAERFNLDLLRIGDVLNNGSHSFLIYDLFVENGHVTKIKAKQATSGVSGTTANGATYRWDLDGYNPFVEPTSNGGDVNKFDHFRFKNFETNVSFKPFDIDVYDDNGNVNIDYNFAICPIAGDKCTFAEGQVIALNFNTNDSDSFNYTHIALRKDDEEPVYYPISEIDTSVLDTSQVGHAIKFNNLTSGKYDAWCTDMDSIISEKCSFIVVSKDDFEYLIDEKGIEITLKNPAYRITTIGMTGIKMTGEYYVPNPLEYGFEYDSSQEVGIILPQKVLIPANIIEGFNEGTNYTLNWIDIMTEFGIQRLKDVPLFEQE